VKEESALFLEKARWHLANASAIAAANIPEVAAKEAYYAMFHAAGCYFSSKPESSPKPIGAFTANLAVWQRTIQEFRKTFCRFSGRPIITSLFPTTRSGRSPGFLAATLSTWFKRLPASSTASWNG
jgi:hypothetical protein